jgi:Lon protease-like protein
MAQHPKTAAPASTAEMPLFPLNTVLFPGGPLPLRIFETRYVDMVRRCMRESSAFGVVLIRAGAEAGAVASTAEIGTSARIVDFSQLPDGLLGISCLGERKFRVVRRWRQADGLNMGEVQWLPAEPEVALPAEHDHLGGLLKKILPEIGGIYEQIPKRFADAAWVGCRLVELLPLSMSDKQACLELDDPLQRIERISPLIRRVDD